VCSFPFVLQRLEACAWIFHGNRAFVDEVIEKGAKSAHLEVYSLRCNGAALAPVRFFAPLLMILTRFLSPPEGPG
jgi:hypothetical protein